MLNGITLIILKYAIFVNLKLRLRKNILVSRYLQNTNRYIVRNQETAIKISSNEKFQPENS